MSSVWLDYETMILNFLNTFLSNFVNEWQNIDEMVYDHDGLINYGGFGKDQSWNVEKF